MGDDLRVANAARVSFAKESNWDNTPEVVWGDDPVLSDKDKKLIKYLANHNHWTPFSHCMITMREKVPIFVARQVFKHQVGFSRNEVSRRYVDEVPTFYTPDVWRARSENKKQGSSEEEIKYLTYEEYDKNWIEIPIAEEYKYFLQDCETLYNKMIKEGVAPEQARMVLPQSMYTEFYSTGSLAAWARAYKLRIDAHTQKETQELAVMWDKVIRPLFPCSWPVLIGE